MPRFKFTTLCLLAVACAIMLAAVPGDTAAKGICGQIKNQIKDKKKKKKFPENGCVTGKDIPRNSLTYEDMKNEAGVDFAEGESFDRSPPRRNTIYAKVNVQAPAFGRIVLTAHVELSTLTPQRHGGALECNIGIARSPGLRRRSPGQKVTGSVKRGVKYVETLLWTRTVQVSDGLSRFDLECKRTDTQNTVFSVNSFLVAEYYSRRY